MSRARTTGATVLGLGAVALWAVLAALTALAGPVPPFQLAAMTFALGTLVGFAWAAMTGQSLTALRTIPFGQWVLGIYGLLAFHVCYFLALQKAPALEASLIIYLWPLLIVLFSGLLPARLGGRRLQWWHIGGAMLGFAGTVLILTASGSSSIAFAGSGSTAGYALALAAAIIWASYSVASRVYASVPSVAVIGSCAATAIGAAILHAATEPWVWPNSVTAWAAIAGLGLGPVGLAFYVWDVGVKHGDIQVLGAASYSAPLLSTAILVITGYAAYSHTLLIACLLITAGAILAASDLLFRRR